MQKLQDKIICFPDKPVITLSPSRSVRENDNIVITCEVTANPAASDIVWKYNGNVINSDETLTLTNVKRAQAGTYTCEASNTMTPTVGNQENGKAQSSTQVTVECKYNVHILAITSLL